MVGNDFRVGNGWEPDRSLLTPELVSAVELRDVFDEQTSFLLTLRAGDFPFGILLHTAHELFGDAATGGGITDAPQATTGALQALASAEPDLWSFGDIAVNDAAGLMLDAMEVTDSFPDAVDDEDADDTKYWGARQLVVTLLEGALDDAQRDEPDAWEHGIWGTDAWEHDEAAGTGAAGLDAADGNPEMRGLATLAGVRLPEPAAMLGLLEAAGQGPIEERAETLARLADLGGALASGFSTAAGELALRLAAEDEGGGADPELWADLARHWTRYSIDYDHSQIRRVGPMKLQSFVAGYLRYEVALTPGQKQQLPSFLRAWVRVCAADRKLSKVAVNKLLSDLDALVPLP